MVSVLEGIRLKNGIVPCGHNFDPSGSPLTWHLWHTRVHVPCKFGVSATSPSEILSSSCCYFRKNWKFKILTPLIFGPPLNFTILKDLVTLHPCTKFGVPRPNGVCARRHKAENGIVPCGHNFDPTGSSLAWHIRHTRVHLPCKFGISATVPSKILSSSCCFFAKKRKFSNFDPPNFWTPLNFTISKDLVTLHPCTKIWCP